MKYFIILLFITISTLLSEACDCDNSFTFCGALEESSDSKRLICYTKYTGNFVPYRDIQGRYEVKLIDLISGEIQPGSDRFMNSDSTFWIISGMGDCNEIFALEEGDHSIMTPRYDGEYSFFHCQQDLITYPYAVNDFEYSLIVQTLERCSAHLCQSNLNLTKYHLNTAIYKSNDTLTSDAYANAHVIYQASHMVKLLSGFATNEDHNVSIIIGACE